MAVQNVSDPLVLLQTAGDTYNGSSLDQTYIVNPNAIQPGDTITIVDQGGSNSVELPAGLEIAGSLVVGTQAILTLSNGAVIDIRGADTFTFKVGQSVLGGDTDGTDLSYTAFAQNILGVSIPAAGEPVAQGGASTVNDDGTAEVGNTPIDPVPTYSLTADTGSVDEGATATFTLTTTNVAAGTEVAYTITGVSAADVTGALSGTATVGAGGTASISVQIAADQLTEGPETLTLSLDNGQASASTIVQDTSLSSGNSYISGLGGNGIVSNFNIEIVFEGAFSIAERAAFETAADYLSSLITGDLPDEGGIDDIRITALLEPIDGPFNVVGFAGPTVLRPGSFLPFQGEMTFDTADSAQQASDGTFTNTVVHEMIHALGFGTIWGNFPDLVTSGADARFTGDNAIAAYNAEFASLASVDALSDFGVPLESDGGHWDEAMFSNEILTPILNSATDYMSTLTVASLEDLGYHTVFDISNPNAIMPQLDNFTIIGGNLLSLLTTAQQVAAIHVGYFDRAADPQGEGFWELFLNSPALSLVDMAIDFSTNLETLSTYPFFLDPSAEESTAFIAEVYLNLFNRFPDSASLEAWNAVLVDAINNEPGSINIGEIILAIIDSAKGNDRATVLNKIEVATAWTDAARDADIDYEIDFEAQNSAAAIVESVTSDVATVIAAKTEIDTFFNEYESNVTTSLFYFLLDEDAELSGNSNRLNNIDVDGIRFTIGEGTNVVDVTIEAYADNIAGSHQGFVNALQAPLQALIADGTLPAGTTLTLDPTITDITFIDNGSLSGAIPAIVLIPGDGFSANPTGFSRFSEEIGEYDVYGRFFSDDQLFYFLLDEDAELVGNPNRLNNIDVDGIRFDIINGDGTRISVIIESPEAILAGSHQGFVSALQTPLQALISDGTLPSGTTLTLDPTITDTTFVDNGSQSDSISAIVLTPGDGVLVEATGFSRIGEEIGEYDVYGRFSSVTATHALMAVDATQTDNTLQIENTPPMPHFSVGASRNDQVAVATSLVGISELDLNDIDFYL